MILSLVVVTMTCLVLLGVKTVADNERLVILRLNRYLGLRGPGLVFVLPFADKVVRVRLDDRIPSWRAMNPAELRERLEQLGHELEREIPSSRDAPR